MLEQNNPISSIDTEIKIQEIAIEKISVPLLHPRRNIGNLKSLEESIRKNGIMEPLSVCLGEDGNYQIIDGSRRLTVIASFGMKTVPCLVREKLNEAQVCHLAFVMNYERQNLNAIEVATNIRTMRERFGYSLREMEAFGYGSAASISNSLKLLEIAKPVQEMIVKGELSASHGTELSKLGTVKLQERMAKQAVDLEWSAKRTAARVTQIINKGKKEMVEPVKVPEGDIPGVYFKDSTDMSELPDRCVHLIVSSPPYFVGMEYEKGISYEEHWDNISKVMDESARVLVSGGIIALNVGDIFNFKGPKGNNDYSQVQLVGHKYQTFLRKHNILLTDVINWIKADHVYPDKDVSKLYSDKMAHTDYRIIPGYEPIYIFRHRGAREIPSEEVALQSRITKEEWSKWTTGVWRIDSVRKMDGHPAIFPDELVQRLVKMFSYEGEIVLDPFLGSGTTVKVARQVNRQAYGYERLEQYKEVIMKKLGLNPDEAVAEATTMAEYFDQTMPPEEKAVKSEFFGRMTQSEETAEDDLDVESDEEFAALEAVC